MTRRSPRAAQAQTAVYAAHADDLVGQLREEIGAPQRPHGMPAIVVLMGLPGVGKSHCARALTLRLGAAHVASDQLRSRLFVAASYSDAENAMVFRCLERLIDDLIVEGHRVIADATHLRTSSRATVVAVGARRNVPVVQVHVTADDTDARRRLAERRTGRAPEDHSEADERVYERMAGNPFEPPAGGHLTVRNGPDLDEDLERVAETVERLCGRAS